MRYTIKTLFVLTAGVAVLLSQLPASERHDVLSGSEVLYSLELPNPRFWIVAAVEAVVVIGWLIYTAAHTPEITWDGNTDGTNGDKRSKAKGDVAD
jgi:L-aminopeptidase/D-esterase-like protein